MNLRKIINEGCVIKTSGTTGTPKDIIQTPEKLKAADEIAIASQRLTSKSKVYTICKTTHAGGLLAQTLPAFRIGAEVSIEPFNAFAFSLFVLLSPAQDLYPFACFDWVLLHILGKMVLYLFA